MEKLYVLPYGQMSLWGNFICPKYLFTKNIFYINIIINKYSLLINK